MLCLKYYVWETVCEGHRVRAPEKSGDQRTTMYVKTLQAVTTGCQKRASQNACLSIWGWRDMAPSWRWYQTLCRLQQLTHFCSGLLFAKLLNRSRLYKAVAIKTSYTHTHLCLFDSAHLSFFSSGKKTIQSPHSRKTDMLTEQSKELFYSES